jgi:hypothetical protein
MKSLYESILSDNEIEESLLSDIDTNLDKGESDVIDVLINDPDNSLLWHILDLSKQDVGRKYPLKYQNKTLYIPRSGVRNIGGLQPLDVVIGADVDNLVIGGGLYLRMYGNERVLSDRTLCKQITCGSGINIVADTVKNLDLYIGCLGDIGVKQFPSIINYTCFNGVTHLENVNWHSDKNVSITFEVDEIPTIKNCNLQAAQINIYSPDLFNNDKLTKEIQTKWMLPNYEYEYLNKNNDIETVVINNFKKLHSIVNQPKKYRQKNSAIKCFKDDIKASDIIPWINKIPSIDIVKLCNDKVAIYLHRKTSYQFNDISAETVDGWKITLSKKV